MVAAARQVTTAAALVAVPKLIGGAALIALNVWVAHRLPLAAYGIFTIGSTGLLLLDGVVGAALDAGVIRTAGEATSRFGTGWHPAERAGIVLKVAAAAVAMVLASAVAAAAGRPDVIPFVVAVLGAGAGMLVLRSVLVHLQLRERFLAYGLTDLAHTSLRWMAVAIVCAAGYATAAGVIGAYALAPWTIAAIAAVAMSAMDPAREVPEGQQTAMPAASRRLLAFALLTLSTTAVGAVVARLDIFVIGAAASSEQAGVFGAAATIALIPTWIGAYLAPAFSARIIPLCRAGAMHAFLATMQRRLIVIGVTGAVVGFVAAPSLVRMLLPASYAQAADIVPVLLVSGIAGFVTFPLVLHTLLFLSPRTYLVMDLVSLPVIVPLYILMAQRSGAIGVAWVTALSAVTKAVIAQLAARAAVRRAEFQSSWGATSMKVSAVVLSMVVVCAGAAFAQTPEETDARARAVPPVTVADEGAYRLVSGDAIDIKFMQNSELDESVTIRPDGRISMPLVGELLVAGTSISELSTRLATAYADILRSPSITIQVRSFANRRVFVGGEVSRPGMLPLGGRETALGAVMEAGGFKTSAKRNEVVVIRRGDEDTPRTIILSMDSGPKGEAPEAASFALEPLDVVLVAESGVARAGRAMDQYVRQMMPIVVTGGFSWLFGSGMFGGK